LTRAQIKYFLLLNHNFEAEEKLGKSQKNVYLIIPCTTEEALGQRENDYNNRLIIIRNVNHFEAEKNSEKC
jgi:hypothetical protein